jgi:ABC-type xylose transport system permease subunit
MTIKQRWKAETPDFWKKVQKIGLISAALGGAIATAPVSLPAAVVTFGGYLLTAGAMAGILSKLTVKDGAEVQPEN